MTADPALDDVLALPEPAPVDAAGPAPRPVEGAALTVRDVVKDFRGHRAVDGISLDVRPGEVVGLLGPNGAGKSTTMKICSGVARPTSGSVTVVGHDLAGDPLPGRYATGYVPDVGGLFPRLTGWEHVELGARVRGLAAADWVPRARDLLGRLGLGDAAGRRAGSYSHGMGRKLSLAVALLSRPPLLLLDEPFDGVDPAGSVAIRELVAEATAGGAGVLVSTHLLDAAEKISDRLVVVRLGRVLVTGTAADLRQRAGRLHGPLEDAYLTLMAEAGAPLASSGWTALAAGEPAGVRALLWLKSREWLGESREPTRLILGAIGLVTWWALLAVGCVVAIKNGQIPLDTIRYVSAAAWPLWALVPLLGGGGGEVVAAHRLAAYPVSPRAVFGAAWVTSFVDIPFLIVLPLVVGLYTAGYGVIGLLGVIAFAAGASGLGQLAAWASFLVLSGRKRSGLTALLLTGGVVALITVAPSLLGTAGEAAAVLPSGWLDSLAQDVAAGHYGPALLWVVALAVPLPVTVLVGPRLATAALDREARSGGVGATTWGEPGRAVQGSLLRALVVADARCTTRAVGAQVALAGVLAVPALTRLPGLDVSQISLTAMGSVAAIAAATVLGLNGFAFQAGGASLLLGWPVPPRLVIASKAIVIVGCLLGAEIAVTVLGAFALGSTLSQTVEALVLDLARALVMGGLSVLWSVWFPSASDYDSLRARIAAPRSVISFAVTAAVATYAVVAVAKLGPAWHGLRPGLAVVVVAAGLVGLVAAVAAVKQLAGAGTERVASGVAG